MHIQRKSLYILRITTDVITLSISFILAEIISYHHAHIGPGISDHFLLFILLFIWLVSSRVSNIYDEFRSRNFSFELIRLIKNVLVQVVATVFILFFLKEISLSRTFVIYYSGILIILVSLEKYLFRRILNLFRRKGRNLRSLLIIGAGEVGKKFYDSVRDNPHFGYEIVGFLDDEKKNFPNGKYLGKINHLEFILNKNRIDDVVIALPNYAFEKLERVVAVCEQHTTRVRIIPDYFKMISPKYNVSMFGKFPIISVREDRLNELHWRILKRGFDTIVTIIVFLSVFSWLWPIISLLIKVTSPGPIFFKQERWGRNNKKFIAYKFRSMRSDSVDVNREGRYQQAVKDDPRITEIGKFLRKTNLDELPQFLNVLRGEMSLVGPRPHPIPLNLESKGNIKHYMLRHLVKPGITGWAQVNGYRGETKKQGLMEKRVEYDLWYIENWSFWLDLQIMFQTLWNMIKGDPNAY